MKKKNLKTLKLRKQSISSLKEQATKGGTSGSLFSGARTCPEPFVETINITICWNGIYCELRDNGC